MNKELEPGSEYNKYDTDGDGVVTDSELATTEKLQALELKNERATQQASMAWFGLYGMVGYTVLVIASQYFNLTQAAAILGDMAAVYFVSTAGIVGAFFAAESFKAKNGNGKQ